MTILQRELNLKLPELDCSSQYDMQTGHLNIFYEGTILCSLHRDGILAHYKNYHIGNNRSNKYYTICNERDLIDEYLSAYEISPQVEVDGVKGYRKLAEYNKIVLAAKDCKDHGFMFTTWRRSADCKSLNGGDYSRCYKYAKQSFAARSGLINKNQLFSSKEAEKLYRCIHYTCEQCDGISFDQEKELKELLRKIENAYLDIEESPPLFEESKIHQLDM